MHHRPWPLWTICLILPLLTHGHEDDPARLFHGVAFSIHFAFVQIDQFWKAVAISASQVSRQQLLDPATGLRREPICSEFIPPLTIEVEKWRDVLHLLLISHATATPSQVQCQPQKRAPAHSSIRGFGQQESNLFASHRYAPTPQLHHRSSPWSSCIKRRLLFLRGMTANNVWSTAIAFVTASRMVWFFSLGFVPHIHILGNQ